MNLVLDDVKESMRGNTPSFTSALLNLLVVSPNFSSR